MSVNLRAAEIDNYWRRVRERKYSSRIESLNYSSLSCLLDGTITFNAGITAIIGGNGVGKSTVAAAVAEVLIGSQSDAQSIRVFGSELLSRVVFRGKEIEFYSGEGEFEADVDGIPAAAFGWIDPTFATRILNVIHDDANFAELLEGITPLELSSDDLLLTSYLVNKKYSQFLIYEIEDYRDIPVFPYFKVRSGDGAVYSSESMGSGELSLLIHFWMLRKLERNSILILEEPETYISPRSQMALMNVLAKFSSEKLIWTIVTTHSPTILKRIPLENIRLLTQNAGVSIFTKQTTRKQIDELLGEGSTYRACILVEDEGARAFLQTIVDRQAPDLLSSIEILSAGDENSIVQVVQSLPKTGKWLQVVGVFDGNMKTSRENIKRNWPILFLPGDADPDLLLQETLHTDEARTTFASLVGRSLEEISVACNALRGLNHHDWPFRMSEFLNSDIHSIRKHLVSVWLEKAEHLQFASDLVMQIRASLAA